MNALLDVLTEVRDSFGVRHRDRFGVTLRHVNPVQQILSTSLANRLQK